MEETIKKITNTALVNKSITEFLTPIKTLTLQESQNFRKAPYELQEAVTDIGVERIVESIEVQYFEEINK